MKSEMKKAKKLLFVFSECDNSPQLFSIYQKFASEIPFVKVLLILPRGTQLERELRMLGVSYKRWSPRTKWMFWVYSIAVSLRLLLNKVDVVLASGQTATYIAIPAAFITKVPQRIFIRHHADFHHTPEMKIGFFADSAVNFLSTTIIAVSILVRDILVSVENVSKHKVKLIPNGFNVSSFLKVREKITLEKEQIVIGTVGRFTHLKGLKHVVEAFVDLAKSYPNIHLIMLGAPADETPQIELALKNLDETRYDLVQSFTPMPDFYRKIDILVHIPIGPYREAFGLVYLEALASGCLCAFTRSGVLYGDTSFDNFFELVEFQNSSSLAKILEKLIGFAQFDLRNPAPASLFVPYSLEIMANDYWAVVQNA
jgi:glycosyltransferase involved in cell wall biosynthesis